MVWIEVDDESQVGSSSPLLARFAYWSRHRDHSLSISPKLALPRSDLLGRLLSTDIKNRSHLRQLGRYLKEQGWFPNPGSPDKDQTSGPSPPLQGRGWIPHLSVLVDGHLLRSHLPTVSWVPGFPRQGECPGILDLCSTELLHKKTQAPTSWRPK